MKQFGWQAVPFWILLELRMMMMMMIIIIIDAKIKVTLSQ